MSDSVVSVSPDGAELRRLAASLTGEGRRIIGLAGVPGSGKSTLADELVSLLGASAVCVPMDGFHLADVQLAAQRLLGRKGAPETFDAWGYASLLGRLRARPDHPVYAPGFERDLEQPLAGAIHVAPEVEVVVTEGNYLLLDRPEWREVRAQLDQVWYVVTDERVRRDRLVARHVAFGKSREDAEAWVRRVDDRNSRLVEATRDMADLVIRLLGVRAPPPE